MSMFDWSSGSYGSVHESFWIYWVVAVPLTIITLTCWGLWWNVEKSRFERDVQQAITQQDVRQKRLFDTAEGILGKVKGSGEQY